MNRIATTTLQIFLLNIATVSVWAQDAVQIGRYSTVSTRPTPEQMHVLQALVTQTFPRQQVRTVGEAIHYLLAPSGYQLADLQASDPTLRILLSRLLPEVQRTLGPCSLQDALRTLAGPAYRLVHDPINRLVSFDVTPAYQGLAHSVAYAASSGHVTAGPAAARRTGSYGPLRYGQTLQPIAERLRPADVTVEQMMLALLDVNPQAFGRIAGQPNINLLLAGAILQLPAAERSQRWSPRQAQQEVRRQYRRWRELSQRSAASH